MLCTRRRGTPCKKPYPLNVTPATKLLEPHHIRDYPYTLTRRGNWFSSIKLAQKRSVSEIWRKEVFLTTKIPRIENFYGIYAAP